MRRIAVSVFVALICNFANAQQAPIVAVWEQLPVADANGGANAARHNIVFVDQKIADDIASYSDDSSHALASLF
ncbi:hypothetical protein [Paraburkholderia dipogonis]|uniref:hypothetical protein n=1 Tax=Paraburkholderia dipogonis TaxID=1211383 RepID=UPI0038B95BB0